MVNVWWWWWCWVVWWCIVCVNAWKMWFLVIGVIMIEIVMIVRMNVRKVAGKGIGTDGVRMNRMGSFGCNMRYLWANFLSRTVCIWGSGWSWDRNFGLVTILRIRRISRWIFAVDQVGIVGREACRTSIGTGFGIAGATERCRWKVTCRRTVASVGWVCSRWWWWRDKHRWTWSSGYVRGWESALSWPRRRKICVSVAVSLCRFEAFKSS